MTTRPHRWARAAALLAALTLVAAACGSDDEATPTTQAPATTSAPAETEAPADTEAPAETEAPADTEAPAAAAAGLAACPNPLIIQTDWFPEPEHGALYQLTGGAGAWDGGAGAFVGPLAADPSIEIQIRPGGPFIGFQSTITVMEADEDIFLGYTSIDSIIDAYADFPYKAVVAPLEKNPQIIMWDPETYPGIETFADIGATGATINVFGGSVYMEYLIGTGQIEAGQEDGSYDGSPTRFIAEDGQLFQQGFATQEPWNYENLFEEWGQPVEFLLIHDSGYEIYSQPLGVRLDRLDDPAVQECLTAFVPIVQQASIDFQNDPAPVNDAIFQAIVDIDDFWQLDRVGMDNTVKVMNDLGIVGNGPDDILGNFELSRVQGVIDILADPDISIEVPEGLTPEDIVTNEFIDPSIGY